MPAATIRSATSCAAPAGVQTTPIAISRSRTISGRSSMCWIRSPPARSPTLPGSESTSATASNPRSEKPR